MLLELMRHINPLHFARYASDSIGKARRASHLTDRTIAQILYDQIALRFATGISRREYYLYKLYEGRLSWDEKLAYLAESQQKAVWFKLNPVPYWRAISNKLLFSFILEANGLPTPRQLGLFDEKVGRTVDDSPLRTAQDIGVWLERCPVEGLVFKPVEGLEGRAVRVFKGRRADDRRVLISLDSQEVDPYELFHFMTNQSMLASEFPDQAADGGTFAFIVQERVIQHAAITELVGATLCCARVMTLLDHDGRPTVLSATIKLQEGLSGVDNMAQGSINAPIDLVTGALGHGRRPKGEVIDGYDSLPGSPKSFVGFNLPCWQELKELATLAATVVPWCRCLGWDIAFAADGPTIIEANPNWSPMLVQASAERGFLSSEVRRLL